MISRISITFNKLNFSRTTLDNYFIQSNRNITASSYLFQIPDKDKMTNELKNELSPYLLQHQNNPVQWHPWNSETLELAKNLNKPIFLSSGYSTCHWCHVMERESFENESIAAIMNENFVNIKLDREERPNIDGLYMHVVQAISGGGGWPMSVWLTPNLLPFYAGTYFPPEDKYYGRPGFRALLLTLAEHWNESPEKCIESGEKILEVLKKSAIVPPGDIIPIDATLKCRNQLGRSYEPSYGGFSEQPKFPQPVNLQFLIHFSRQNFTTQNDTWRMVDKTLRSMRSGGIYDHLAHGFCRYSTDKKWHVPHFEKMLYDQAQLASVYLSAFLLSKDAFFKNSAEEVLRYVNRDMRIADGGFYSAEDADSLPTFSAKEKKEGAFYVWEKGEIERILTEGISPSEIKQSELFCERFGAKLDGNVDPYQDPHDELKKKNVLYEAKSIASLATQFKLAEADVEAELEKSREILFQWRNTNRPRPHLDNKFIASWNGLMISAFANSGFSLNNNAYVKIAEEGIEFIKRNFYKDGDLLRTAYSDSTGSSIINLTQVIPGCVDDYANVIGALLDTFVASGKLEYLELAITLQKKQNELFWDEESGGYFTGRANDPSIIVRFKDDDDGAEPSSNSTSLINLLRLRSIDELSEEFNNKAKKLLLQFSDRLSKIPITLPLMTATLGSYEKNYGRIIIIGSESAIKNSDIYSELRQTLLPLGTLVFKIYSSESSENIEKLRTLLPSAELESRVEKFKNDGVLVICMKNGQEKKIETCAELKEFLNDA